MLLQLANDSDSSVGLAELYQSLLVPIDSLDEEKDYPYYALVSQMPHA